MKNNLEHAEQAVAFCEQIKEGVRGLTSLVDISDDEFGESGRLGEYRTIFRLADAWQKKYTEYIAQSSDQDQGNSMSMSL